MKAKWEYNSKGNYKGKKGIAQELLDLKLLSNCMNPMGYLEAVNIALKVCQLRTNKL